MERTLRSWTVALAIAMAACASKNNNELPDAGTFECAGCHAATSLSAAHSAHLGFGDCSSGFTCTECHPAYNSLSHSTWPTKVQFATAKGDIATSGGLSPAWDSAAMTCSSVYCHGGGAAVTGGNSTEPKWTLVDGSQDKCDSCHGFPPSDSVHVQKSPQYCHLCHADVTADGKISIYTGLHVNGVVDVLPKSQWGTVQHGASTKPIGHPGTIDFASCETCHGATPVGNAPSETMTCGTCHNGTTPLQCATCHDVTKLSGAHAVHAAGSSFASAISCSECHKLYTDVDHELGDPVVTFATGVADIANKGGLSPSWNAASATCSSVYCHGGNGTDGKFTRPVWTKVDGTQAQCDSCHGFTPKANNHVQTTTDYCTMCHTTLTSTGTLDNSGKLHINGAMDVLPAAQWGTVNHGKKTKPIGHGIAPTSIDFSPCEACHGPTPVGNAPSETMSCATCHGGSGSDGGTDGGTDGGGTPLDCMSSGCHSVATLSTAHATHLNGSYDSAPVSCSECHTQYSSLDHISPTAVITFATGANDIANKGGLTPTWNATDHTCASVYCHGGGTTVSGGAVRTPDWRKVDGSQIQCNSCHGMSPTASPHVQTTSSYCFMCHAGVDKQGHIIAGQKQLHVNGTWDVLPSDQWGTVGHGPPGCLDADAPKCGYSTPPGHPDDYADTWADECAACHSNPTIPAKQVVMTCGSCHAAP